MTAIALGAASCGGGQSRGTPFDAGWIDDHGAAMAAFARTFRARVPAGADVAVGVVGSEALVGVPLDGGAPWTFTHELHGRPAIAGSVVVAAGGGEIFALDARTGKLLWSRPSGGRIRGVGDDGATTVISLIPTTGLGSLVLVITRDGSIVRQIEDDQVIGVPAIAGDAVFLPWQGRFLSVYDLPSGEERARIDLHRRTSRVFALGGAIFAGEESVTRFDEHLAKAATTVELPKPIGGLPGDPGWMRPGGDWIERTADALDKVRLYARPAARGPAAIDGGRFAATYFRAALGFDARSGAIAWAHAHDADFLGGAAYAGGFALCDASGAITFFDGETGAATAGPKLDKPVSACLVQADAFARPAARATASLADQLAEVVLRPEAELTALQQTLLRELAKQGGDRATKALIDLAASDRTAPALLADARAALAARRSGAAVMLEALARRYDYLAGALRAPPVGPLADALAATGEKRAAPLLAAHLGDPASTSDDVERAAAALAVLAGPAEAPAIEAFFAQYRAIEGPEVDAAVQRAVVSAATALLRLGARDAVAAAVADPRTSPAVRDKLVELIKRKG